MLSLKWDTLLGCVCVSCSLCAESEISHFSTFAFQSPIMKRTSFLGVSSKSSDRMWSTEEGNDKPLQYSCLENPMNSMNRQNDRIPKEELLRSFSSVQFSHSVVSDSLRPHESQRARPPCPSPTPGVHSDSRPLSQWCHPAISSSVVPFSSCPQSLPASKSFLMSQLFSWGGQSTGFSFSIIPSKEIPGLISFRMDWLDLLAVQGTLRQI